MAKLQLHANTPSAEVVAKAGLTFSVHDDAGRTIVLKKAGILAQYRLIEALGDTAKNEVYTRMCLPLIYVSAIDDEPVLPLARKSDIEALIQRLDEHGIAAVVAGVNDHFGQPDPEKDRAAVKN